MTTEAERLADHFEHLGKLLEVTALLRSQEAEIKQLKSEMADQGSSIERLRKTVAAQTKAKDAAVELWNEAGKEIERKDALLRQALDVLKQTRAIININLQEVIPMVIPNPYFSAEVDTSIARIKQHVEDTNE